jgi:hypothetical protein
LLPIQEQSNFRYTLISSLSYLFFGCETEMFSLIINPLLFWKSFNCCDKTTISINLFLETINQYMAAPTFSLLFCSFTSKPKAKGN